MKQQKTSQARFLAAVVFCAAALCLFASPPAFAANGIRILVNDQPITDYDIDQRTKMMSVFTHGKAGKKEAIEQLIDEQLMVQEAARHQLGVTDAEIEQEVANRAQAAKLTAPQFEQAMRQAGFDPKTFRQFMRANMLWARIVRARFRATVNITDQDIAAALGGHGAAGEQQAATEYRLQQIIFLVPSGSGDAAAAQQLSEAKAFRERFQGCDNAIAQAGGSPTIAVKPEVRREEAKIPEPLKSALAALSVGGTTAPERSAEGFDIIAVCAKNAITGETQAAVAKREEITDERGQLLARRYLHDLRSDAVIEYR